MKENVIFFSQFKLNSEAIFALRTGIHRDIPLVVAPIIFQGEGGGVQHGSSHKV